MPRVLMIVCAFVLTSVGRCPAGLYHPDTLAGFEIDPQGKAIALSFDTFTTMVTLIKKADDPESDSGKAIVERLRSQLAHASQLSPVERVALASDLLRFRSFPNGPALAIDLIKPYRNDPPPGLGFLVSMIAAEAFVRQEPSQFHEAMTNVESALLDFKPTTLPGLTADQLRWYLRMEREYGMPFLRGRAAEATAKSTGPIDTLDPLFPPRTRGKHEPVRFVGEDGQYSVGSLADVQKRKLPADAIAIVQQLILWNPFEARLWWLLAELYNAEGDHRSAARAFKVCVDGMKFAPTELRRHQEAVLPMAQSLAAAEAAGEFFSQLAVEQVRRIDSQDRIREYLVFLMPLTLVFALVGYWQYRELSRRWRARRGNSTRIQDSSFKLKS